VQVGSFERKREAREARLQRDRLTRYSLEQLGGAVSSHLPASSATLLNLRLLAVAETVIIAPYIDNAGEPMFAPFQPFSTFPFVSLLPT
jgi:hypothetical protein